jgi:hypothetical protein
LWADVNENPEEVVLTQANATGSGGEISGCHMQEDSAPSTADDWAIIVSENHDDVIECICPPQILGAAFKGLVYKAIIAGRCGIVAPTLIGL